MLEDVEILEWILALIVTVAAVGLTYVADGRI